MASKNVIKLSGGLKELRLHLCQKSPASAGARQFVETHYVPIKMSNPKFPILVSQGFFADVCHHQQIDMLDSLVSGRWGILELRKTYFQFRRHNVEYFWGKMQFSPQNCKKCRIFDLRYVFISRPFTYSAELPDG